MLGFGTAHADTACRTLAVSQAGKLTVGPGKDLPQGTKTIGVLLPGGIEHPQWQASGGSVTITDKQARSLRAEYDNLSAADKPNMRLQVLDAADKLLETRCPDFAVVPAVAAPAAPVVPAAPAAPAAPPAGAAVVPGGPVVVAAAGGNGNATPPMTPMECEQMVNSEIAKTQSRDKYIVFNSQGQLCFQSTPIAQGDMLRIALAVRSGENALEMPQGNLQTCSLRSATPNVYGAGVKLPQVANQGQTTYPADTLIPLTTRRCFDDQLTINLQALDRATGPKPAEANVGTAVQVQQYKRYQAGVYLGVVSSDLRDGDFGLRSLNGGNVIYDKNPQKRGPVYNVSVVVYGVANYITQGLGYQGRDLVNDNGPLDRLGFVVAAGLTDPGKRFGMGLSYELIRGVNLQVLYEWANTKQLVDYSVGDPFTGTADQIPTHNEWDHTTSVGVSFDLTYVTQLFTRN